MKMKWWKQAVYFGLAAAWGGLRPEIAVADQPSRSSQVNQAASAAEVDVETLKREALSQSYSVTHNWQAAYEQAARWLADRGHVDAAVSTLDEMAERFAKEPDTVWEAYRAKAVFLLEAKRYSEAMSAMEIARKCLGTLPGKHKAGWPWRLLIEAKFLAFCAEVKKAQNKHLEAIAEYQRLEALTSPSSLGKHDLSDARRAEIETTRLVEIPIEMGKCYEAAGDRPKALGEYRRALANLQATRAYYKYPKGARHRQVHRQFLKEAIGRLVAMEKSGAS